MDHDDGARKSSSAHDRPTRTPSGPRTRTRTKHVEPSSPSTEPALVSRPDSPALDHDASLLPPTPTHTDAAIQVPPTPTLPSAPTPKPAPQKPTAATFIPPPPLTLPPTISFDSAPIPWKGLPLEAAQWTFSSSELQEIVSKAIRLSARESFVRLLSLQALEVDVVQETERLDTERIAAQAKWRFEVGRRTMLMQALNSSAASAVSSPDEQGGNPIMGLVGQLASSIASCDALLSSILHFSDQQSQIAIVQHQHWASALGIALSKVNRTYERQEKELKRAQARIQTLEDELEEAWREAEKMAIEFDDFEQDVATSSTDGSESIDAPPKEDEEGEGPDPDADADEHEASPRPALDVMRDPDDTGTLGDATINTEVAVVLGVTATAVISKATLITSPLASPSPGSPKVVDKSDARSVRSVRSTRSRRSTRDGPSRSTRLAAARLRSRTASNASLRLPKALRSSARAHAPPDDVPPVPAPSQDHSFLDMGNAHPQDRKIIPPQRHPEPMLALPTPPHSASLPLTRVPSIWLETDGGMSTPLNGLDRAHSLQIFSALEGRTPGLARRSNLVMSLTRSDRSSGTSPVDDPSNGTGDRDGDANKDMAPDTSTNASIGLNIGTTIARAASPMSNGSPVSLPTHALTHFRGPSSSSSRSNSTFGAPALRPGSAGARLTSAIDEAGRVRGVSAGAGGVGGATPRRSLVSRASSVILRRLSQATTIGRSGGGGGGGSIKGSLVSPFSSPRSREGVRVSVGGAGRVLERWREGRGDGDDGEGAVEGEVMLIGSLHAESLDAP